MINRCVSSDSNGLNFARPFERKTSNQLNLLTNSNVCISLSRRCHRFGI